MDYHKRYAAIKHYAKCGNESYYFCKMLGFSCLDVFCKSGLNKKRKKQYETKCKT